MRGGREGREGPWGPLRPRGARRLGGWERSKRGGREGKLGLLEDLGAALRVWGAEGLPLGRWKGEGLAGPLLAFPGPRPGAAALGWAGVPVRVLSRGTLREASPPRARLVGRAAGLAPSPHRAVTVVSRRRELGTPGMARRSGRVGRTLQPSPAQWRARLRNDSGLFVRYGEVSPLGRLRVGAWRILNTLSGFKAPVFCRQLGAA